MKSAGDILQCISCARGLDSEGRCPACGDAYKLKDGLFSFVQEDKTSALDDIDYDARYKVDRAASEHLFRQCQRFLGPALPLEVDSFLEIGAGTGLFTTAYLHHGHVRAAVITDISRKMLRHCRERLASCDLAKDTEITFATWDGMTPALADHSVDFAAGFSVLHHVLDYPRMIAKLGRSIRPGGSAVFLEPNLRFHVALVNFMCELFGNIGPDEPAWTQDDRLKVLCWIRENFVNVKYAGDAFVLQSREDKHLFELDELRKLATTHGFDEVEFVPFAEEGEIVKTIGVYMGQLALSPSALEDINTRTLRMLPGAFALLRAEDAAPSSLILLRKGNSASSRVQAATDARNGLAFARHPDPLFRYQLSFDVVEGDVQVDGWVLADVDIRYVRLETSRARLRYPVGGVRMDVAMAINSGRHYPQDRALFSGVFSPCRQGIQALSDGRSLEASVIAETMDGVRYLLGTVELGVFRKTAFEAHDVRPLQRLAYPAAPTDGEDA